MFEGIDFTGFWDDDDYALKNYVGETPTDDYIKGIEEELGYKLPASYIWLMKQHNGGMPNKCAIPTKEPTSWADDHMKIEGIFGVDRNTPYSVCGKMGNELWLEEWEYPPIGVAICDCPSGGHDMVFLDYTECGKDGEPRVVVVDAEDDYRTVVLADTFEDFIRGLVDEGVYDE